MGAILQFFYIYYFTAQLKSGDSWHKDYTAVYYALELKEFRHGLSVFLLQFPNLLKSLTILTLIFEYAGPIMIFSPILNSLCRLISILGFIGLHLGFGVCLDLYQFIYVPMFVVMMFLPSVFWERLSDYLYNTSNSSASTSSRFWSRYKKKEPMEITIHLYQPTKCTRLEFALRVFKALQLEPFKRVKEVSHNYHPNNGGQMNIDKSTLAKTHYAVQIGNEILYDQYDSFRALLLQSFLFFPFGSNIIYCNRLSRYLVTSVLFKYLNQNTNEHSNSIDSINSIDKDQQVFSIGKSTKKQLKSIVNWIKVIFCSVAIIYVFYYNHHLVPKNQDDVPTSPHFTNIANLFKIDQYWGMFAPDPPPVSRWTVVSGTFENKSYQDIDLLDLDSFNNTLDFQVLPKYIHSYGQRYRNYLLNTAFFDGLKLNYGRYLCRKHNYYYPIGDGRGRLVGLKMYTVSTTTPNPLIPKDLPNTLNININQPPINHAELVWDHVC